MPYTCSKFINHDQPPDHCYPIAADEATGCAALAALAAKAASGELAALKAQPEALAICIPAFTDILASAIQYLTVVAKPPQEPGSGNQPVDSTASSSEGQQTGKTGNVHGSSPGSICSGQQQMAVAQQWIAIAKVLTDILHREQVEQLLLPLIVQCFSLQHSTAVTHLCIGLLQHMPVLYDTLGLYLYLTHLHQCTMRLIVAPDSYSPAAAIPGNSSASLTQTEIAASFERAQLVNAASTALCSLVTSKLTLPVVLEHVTRALLMALGNSPDVAVALIGVGSAIGGDMAALHLLPSLVMILVSSTPHNTFVSHPSQVSPAGTPICTVSITQYSEYQKACTASSRADTWV